MPVFVYRAADRRGQTIDGVMEAPDARAVVERLQRDAYFPIRVAPHAERAGWLSFGGSSRVSQRDLLAFTQQLDMQLTIGIDTHADIHVAVALDQFGRRLDTCTIPTTNAGFTALLDWSKQFGSMERIGMEGTGSYGAGLARWLRSRGFAVFEVERPKRQLRRRRGKSDPIDAEAAARAVQAGTALGQPRELVVDVLPIEVVGHANQ